MTLLVHVFQYWLHHLEIHVTDTDTKNDDHAIPITDLIMGTSLTYTHISSLLLFSCPCLSCERRIKIVSL